MLMALLLGAQQPDLGWLAGRWCTEPKAGALTCEEWRPGEGGLMQGVGTTRAGGRVVTNEVMTIRVDSSGATFHAEPRNQESGDFRMVRFDPAVRSVTFEEPNHDYPQRLRYWREREVLRAEISMLDGSKKVQWTFHPVK